MSTSTSEPRSRAPRLAAGRIRTEIAEEARRLGFDACRFTPARLPDETGRRLDRAIADGHHATMAWLAATAARRRSPRRMWPQARTAIVLGMNYGPASDPLASLRRADRATLSVYARGRDYHDVVKGRLKQIAGRFAARTGAAVKVFVDTAPLMEKPLAEQAGLGWQGKHTNLVSRQFGSWLFLGVILTDAAIEPDAPETDHCGSCRACLDICPTDAFPAPYRLDARRCISYLTIEHHGPIPRELRAGIGNRVFGCDDCLAVCPWNKYARAGREAKLAARSDLAAPDLAFLAGLDEAAFRVFFSASPVKRLGRDRFIRNVLTAIGNSGRRELAAAARPHLADSDATVRGAAVWALSRLLPADEMAALRPAGEADAGVAGEWRRALGGGPAQ
ncbi:MAG: epoxyqueuosine reductase [Alphaproteobacteria bacterium]|nr:MAG: epoxyqueuosine reductase [Alphaproteobacteria bacterium]